MSLPSDTTGYLHQEVLKNARYLVIVVDKYGLVAKQDCPGIHWRLEGLKAGRKLPDDLQGIIDASADSTAPQLFPYVQLTDSVFADVHVLNRGDEKHLILQDVSGGHDDEYKLQQKAHEVSLLLEQQAELNRELAEKRHEAEQASKAKSRFIASMSHEFRSPITSIMGHAEMLEGKLPDSQRPAAIHRASWHLLTLVENLLEQARMGEDVSQFNLAPLDVAGVLGDMHDLFAVQAQSKGLQFYVESPEITEPLVSDELRLRQILINLISNAFRYTDEGEVRVSCAAGDSGLRFAISDTGVGIHEDDIENIFKPFTRVNSNVQGAGLGLTISQQLVEALGGTLELTTQPGEGSTFCFSLPMNADDTDEAPGDLSGIRILLVEDDDDLREMYKIYMEEWGMDVTAVNGYQAALEAFAANPSSVVMADYHLADGLGTDLLDELASTSPDCGQILCSGSGYTADGSHFDEGLVHALLIKPISADFLRSTIRKTVSTD